MVKIFDQLVPRHLQDYFELITLGKTPVDDEVLHPLVDFKVKYESTAIENNIAPMSFVHVLKSSTVLSAHMENFGLVPQLVCSEFNCLLQSVVMARIYLILPYNTALEHYAPHIDLPFDHTVILYYINNADGDTVLYDNNRNIVKRVTPKKGRVLVFDGSTYHSGGIPKKGPRAVVNFDITVKGTMDEC